MHVYCVNFVLLFKDKSPLKCIFLAADKYSCMLIGMCQMTEDLRGAK